MEVTTWAQLNYHLKPVGMLNVDGYYDHLLRWVEHASGEGFIRPLHKGLIHSETTAEALLAALDVAEVPEIGRWIDNP